MKKGLKILLGLLAVIAIAAIGCGVYLYSEISGGGVATDAEIEVTVAQGSSTAMVANALKEADVIGNPLIFRVYSRLKGYDGTYQYGTHKVRDGMSYDALMKILSTPVDNRPTANVTVPEGFTVPQIAEALEKAGVCSAKDFIQVLESQTFDLEIEKHIDQDKDRILQYEGFLFPETYTFYLNDDPARVAKVMLTELDNKITQDMYDRMDALGYTLDEIITLASVIQRESYTKESMKKVSGVFHNRLNSGSYMPKLESDVTILFLDTYDDYGIKYTKKQADSYNTYNVAGLPEGPVACPGLDCIEAALYPEDNDYYFFVTDGYKNYYYSKTYEQHLIYVEKCRPTWNH